MSKDPRPERVGVSGYNKPKRTPNHPTKSHVVVAKCSDGSIKTIRFGQQGHRVIATDLSMEMISITSEKVKSKKKGKNNDYPNTY